MGAPKALLTDSEGVPFILRVVQTLAAAGLEDVLLVTGTHHDDIVDLISRRLDEPCVRIVRNPDPSRGQLSSLLCGLEAIDEATTDAILMTLVDVPFTRVSTVRAVIEGWRRSRAPIVRPAIGAAHGHPVIFDKRLFDALRRAPLSEGAKSVVRAYAGEIVNVEVDDPGCLVDIDTPEDYRRYGETL